MNHYVKPLPNDWSLADKISFLRRAILIASIRYYDLNENILSDSQYDGICKQEIELEELAKNDIFFDWNQVEYNDVFKDFDGTTGFDLRYKLPKEHCEYLTRIALCGIKDRRTDR